MMKIIIFDLITNLTDHNKPQKQPYSAIFPGSWPIIVRSVVDSDMIAIILTYDWLQTSGAIFLLIRNAITNSVLFLMS